MNNHEKNIVLVTQKSAQIDDPGFNDLYKIGTVANILTFKITRRDYESVS